MIGRMRPFYQAHWDISKDIKHVWLLICTYYIAWIFQWILGDERRRKWWDRQYRVWSPSVLHPWMLLLHMQETALWIHRLGPLSSRGGVQISWMLLLHMQETVFVDSPADILAPVLQCDQHLIGSMTLFLLSTCSWCVVRAYTWLALCLSLLSTCSWCAHTLHWLYVSLSSPHVAGVWGAHTLDWPYVSLSSPPVAGVRIHFIGSMSLSPLLSHVAGVWWAHTLDWLYVSLSSPL